MHHHVTSWIAVFGFAAATAACGRKPYPDAPAPVSESPPGATISNPTPAGGAPTAPDDNPVERRRAILEQRIHFGFDRYDLTEEARAILAAKVEILRADPTIVLRIEGHADERGTDEYNLVLSNRRAVAALRYLVAQGIDERRIETVGYGELQPLAAGHDEPAWALNRRAEFRITGGMTPR